MNCPNGVGVSRGRFRWFKVGGAGTDGRRAMEDFGHADSGDGTTAAQCCVAVLPKRGEGERAIARA